MQRPSPASRNASKYPRGTIAILGASGYSGVELKRLVALHPGVELAETTGLALRSFHP